MIRPAVEGDSAAIAAIWNRAIRETAITFLPAEKSRTDIAAQIAGPLPFVVWETGGGLGGFARAIQFRSGAGYRHTAEHTILLAPGREGRGGGRALMAALEEVLRDLDFHSLWAGVSGENPAGVAFHARLGFDEIARLPEVGRKFDRWMDLVLMRKLL